MVETTIVNDITTKLQESFATLVDKATRAALKSILRKDVKKHSFIKTQKEALEDYNFEIARELAATMRAVQYDLDLTYIFVEACNKIIKEVDPDY